MTSLGLEFSAASLEYLILRLFRLLFLGYLMRLVSRMVSWWLILLRWD